MDTPGDDPDQAEECLDDCQALISLARLVTRTALHALGADPAARDKCAILWAIEQFDTTLARLATITDDAQARNDGALDA